MTLVENLLIIIAIEGVVGIFIKIFQLVMQELKCT